MTDQPQQVVAIIADQVVITAFTAQIIDTNSDQAVTAWV